MKLINKYYQIKDNYFESLIIMKSGIFYEVLNEDVYIMNYFFNYKIKELTNCQMVGFPIKMLSKIEKKLELEKIHYIILENTNIYLSSMSIESCNNYKKFAQLGKKNYIIQKKINNIMDKLNKLKEHNDVDLILNQISNNI